MFGLGVPIKPERIGALVMDVLRDYVEREKTLTEQTEWAVKEADEDKFATAEQVAAMRGRRWSQKEGGPSGWRTSFTTCKTKPAISPLKTPRPLMISWKRFSPA